MSYSFNPFLPSKTYHIYNHANGDDNIFREEDNYRFFLDKYVKYINPVADTFAYCLMKNHFHLMVRIKNVEYFRDYQPFNKTSKVFENLGGLKEEENAISKLVSKSFSNLFNSYTKACNKKYDRIGSLFAPNVKRIQITDDNYFTRLILYIHTNPIHHGFVKHVEDWAHSSYLDIRQEYDSIVKINEIINWFGGKEEFFEAHKNSEGIGSVFD